MGLLTSRGVAFFSRKSPCGGSRAASPLGLRPRRFQSIFRRPRSPSLQCSPRCGSAFRNFEYCFFNFLNILSPATTERGSKKCRSGTPCGRMATSPLVGYRSLMANILRNSSKSNSKKYFFWQKRNIFLRMLCFQRKRDEAGILYFWKNYKELLTVI